MFTRRGATTANHAFKFMTSHQRNQLRDQLNLHNLNQIFVRQPRNSELASPIVRCYATKRRVRDYCVNGMSIDGRFRVALLDTTDALNEACKRWNIAQLNHVREMGDVMSSSIVLCSFLKGEERIRVEMNKGNVHCCAEAIQVGEVRGYLEPIDESAHGHSNMFSVQKIMYDHARPIVSTVECSEEESVDEILTRFFHASEQIPTVVQLTTIPDEDPLNLSGKHSLFSGAIIVQELPSKNYDIGVKELQTDRTRQQLMEIQEQVVQFGDELKSTAKSNSDDYLAVRAKLHEMLFSKFQVNGVPKEGVQPILCLDKSTVRFTATDFLCRCSSDQVVRAFSSSLTDQEVKEIDETKEELNATCEYCNTVYTINSDMIIDYRNQMNEMQQKQEQQQ